MQFGIHLIIDVPEIPNGFTAEEVYVYIQEFPHMPAAIKFIQSEAKKLMDDGEVRFRNGFLDNETPGMTAKIIEGESTNKTAKATIWHKEKINWRSFTKDLTDDEVAQSLDSFVSFCEPPVKLHPDDKTRENLDISIASIMKNECTCEEFGPYKDGVCENCYLLRSFRIPALNRYISTKHN